MAKKSMQVKAARKRNAVSRAIAAGKKPEKATQAYNCCLKCGRPHGFIRWFGMCRICIRELARKGDIPGLKKSSW